MPRLKRSLRCAGLTLAKVEQVLGRIQNLDPAGVAARDLRECLLVQAKNLEVEDQLVVKIIEDHLHYLETKNYAALVRALKRSPEDVKAAVDIILGSGSETGKRLQQRERRIYQPRYLRFQSR